MKLKQVSNKIIKFFTVYEKKTLYFNCRFPFYEKSNIHLVFLEKLADWKVSELKCTPSYIKFSGSLGYKKYPTKGIDKGLVCISRKNDRYRLRVFLTFDPLIKIFLVGLIFLLLSFVDGFFLNFFENGIIIPIVLFSMGIIEYVKIKIKIFKFNNRIKNTINLLIGKII